MPTHSCMAGDWQAATWEKRVPAVRPGGVSEAAAAPPRAGLDVPPGESGCHAGGAAAGAAAAASVGASAGPTRLGQFSGAASGSCCCKGNRQQSREQERDEQVFKCSHPCPAINLLVWPPAASLPLQPLCATGVHTHVLTPFLLFSLLPRVPLLLALPQLSLRGSGV